MLGKAINSVCVKVAGPKGDGKVRIGIDNDKAEISLGKIGPSAGPHLLRLQKVGSTFSAGVCPDYKPGDPFNPALLKIIPDLAATAPFLSKTNSQLFIGGAGTWMAVSLSVDGKPVAAGVARPAAGPAAGKVTSAAGAAPANNMPAQTVPAVGELWQLGGQSGLPPPGCTPRPMSLPTPRAAWLHASVRRS